MKIEVNNVYQKKSISKIKLISTILLFIGAIVLIIWRLYYERAETTGVSSFSEFIGLGNFINNNDNISIDNKIEEVIIEDNRYIPNFTEQSLYNINKIYNLREDGKKIAYLTFDDGPSKDVTPMILDLLKEEGIYGTFFVLGNKVEQYPDVLLRMYNEGHYIANHGYSHVYSNIYKNSDSVVKEYNKCEETIRNALEISNYSTHLFRYPRGFFAGAHMTK